MSAVRPPDSLSEQQVQFWKELVNRISASMADGVTRVPPPEGVEGQQADYWKELVNRVHAVSVHGAAIGPLSKIPGVPSNPDRITRDMLERIVEWKIEQLNNRPSAACRVSFGADWNPSLHPRGPDGKFVKRPWNIDLPGGEIADTSTHELTRFLADTSGEPDMDRILSDDGIRIDGIPDDIDSADELRERLDDPQSNIDVGTNPKDFGQLVEGDVIRTPEGPREVLNKGSDRHLEVRSPEGGREAFDMGSRRRNTVDVFDVDDMDELPSQQTADGPSLDSVTPDDSRFADVGSYQDAQEGDLIRYEKVAPWNEDQEDMEPNVGELLNKTGTVMTVQTKDGEELRFNTMTSGSHTPTGLLEVGERLDDDIRTLDELEEWDVGVANDDFVQEPNEAMPGDFLRLEPRATADPDEPTFARVEERHYSGAEYTATFPNGETERVDGTTYRTEGYLPGNPDSDIPDPESPQGGRWKTGGFEKPDEGDMIRFDSPRTEDYEAARVVENRGMEPMTVETADGEEFRVDTVPDEDQGIHEFNAIFEEGDTVDPSTFPNANEVGRTDLTELDGTPAERREALQGEVRDEVALTTEMVENEEIPEGTLVTKGRGRFVYRVDGYTDSITGERRLEVTTDSGRTRELDVDRATINPYEPGDIPEVTIPDNKWGDDDTPRSQRRSAIHDTLDMVLPEGDDAPDGNDDGPIPDETMRKVKDEVAGHLAASNDKEHAERVVARFTSVGDDIGRAHAVIDNSPWEESQAYFSVKDGESSDTIAHELGHVVGDVYGFRGGSNDMDGKTHPMPNFSWQADDVPNKYGIKTPMWHDDYDDGVSEYDQEMFQLDDWIDEVDSQVGTGLDGRNFSNAESPNDIPAEEGAMVRLDGSPSYGEPRNWRIAEVHDTYEQFGDEHKDVTLESKDGKTARGTIESKAGDDVAVSWRQESDYTTWTGIDGKRNSTPDNWREDPPDPDEWLGTQSIDDPEEAMSNLADKVNKAWYRQAAATRESNDLRDARRYSIKDGYSAKQAHETLSRVHEVMRSREIDNGEIAEAAQTLVKYHPELLEAYRQVYAVPTPMKMAVNSVAEQEGASFRFDNVPMSGMSGVETVADTVEGMYGGAAD